MNVEIAKSAIDFIFTQNNWAEKVNIIFIGGEPLLEFPLIKKIVLYINQKARQFDVKLSYDITTNGMLLNEEILAFFKKHKIKFLLSLDGLPSCHDTHRKTLAGKGSFWKTAKKNSAF